LVHWPLMGGLLHLVQWGGPGRAAAPFSPLFTVPNATAHPSTASVPTSYHSMWHYNCLCTLTSAVAKHCETITDTIIMGYYDIRLGYRDLSSYDTSRRVLPPRSCNGLTVISDAPCTCWWDRISAVAPVRRTSARVPRRSRWFETRQTPSCQSPVNHASSQLQQYAYELFRNLQIAYKSKYTCIL